MCSTGVITSGICTAKAFASIYCAVFLSLVGMLVARPFPLFAFISGFDQMDKGICISMSEGEDDRSPSPVKEKLSNNEIAGSKKHRRGKKRTKRKWKPYSKMTAEERRDREQWEEQRAAKKEAQIAARSSRPIAPFNSTQFLMEDRGGDSNVCVTSPRVGRMMSYESSSASGSSCGIRFTIYHFPECLCLGDDAAYETSEEEEQEAFLEEDFNQVYLELRMDRLDSMSKDDLVKQCFDLEEQLTHMKRDMESLQDKNSDLTDENTKLKTVVST